MSDPTDVITATEAGDRIEVLVVDDDQLVRAGVRAILDAQPDLCVVGEASDGLDAVELVARLRPRLVLMDVRMPGVDGIAATRHLRAAPADPPKILVLTTFGDDDAVHAALRAGADGFVLKRSRPPQLLAAVRTVARGESLLFPPAIRDLAPRSERPGTRRVSAGLSEREGEVLQALASGMSNAEIAADLGLGVETVKSHVGSILGKLRVRDRTQAVVAAYRRGLVDPA